MNIYQQRRDAALARGRATLEKAKSEGRGELTTAEQDQFNAFAESAKSTELLGQLDAMAAGGAHRRLARLSFKGTAELAAAQILPSSYGQKAVAPSGSVVVPQSFDSEVTSSASLQRRCFSLACQDAVQSEFWYLGRACGRTPRPWWPRAR